jgi:hypothetical protein
MTGLIHATPKRLAQLSSFEGSPAQRLSYICDDWRQVSIQFCKSQHSEPHVWLTKERRQYERAHRPFGVQDDETYALVLASIIGA